MAYRGILWPLRLNTRGDFDAGNQRQVIKSDIRTVLQTRRFVNLRLNGERRMRPGAFSVMPFALIKPFRKTLIAALVIDYVEDALSFLEQQGKISVKNVRLKMVQDRVGVRGVSVNIGYTVLVDQLQDEYTFEIDTESPAAEGVRRT